MKALGGIVKPSKQMKNQTIRKVGNTKVSKMFRVSLLGKGSGFSIPRSRKPDLGTFTVVADSVEEAIEKARSAYEDFREGAKPINDGSGISTIYTKEMDPGQFEVESVTLDTEYLVL